MLANNSELKSGEVRVFIDNLTFISGKSFDLQTKFIIKSSYSCSVFVINSVKSTVANQLATTRAAKPNLIFY